MLHYNALGLRDSQEKEYYVHIKIHTKRVSNNLQCNQHEMQR